MESGAALDETCLVRELLVDVPENPALQGMDLESWSMISGEPRKQPSYHGNPKLSFLGVITFITHILVV